MVGNIKNKVFIQAYSVLYLRAYSWYGLADKNFSHKILLHLSVFYVNELFINQLTIYYVVVFNLFLN